VHMSPQIVYDQMKLIGNHSKIYTILFSKFLCHTKCMRMSPNMLYFSLNSLALQYLCIDEFRYHAFCFDDFKQYTIFFMTFYYKLKLSSQWMPTSNKAYLHFQNIIFC